MTSTYQRKPRLTASTEALDAAEQSWWRQFGEVEEQYCWVQTPAVRKLLRERYLRRIARQIPAGGCVLDVGCGTGWLSLWLAGHVRARIHGIDFSSEQIRRAREQLRTRSGPGSVEFHHVTGAIAEVPALAGVRFSAVVMHALLHHLSDEEVRRLLQDLARVAAPDCRVFILEPVLYTAPSDRLSGIRWLIDRLVLLPRMGQRSGLRKMSAREAELAEVIDGRGDSPKETPFLPYELDALLSPTLEITRRMPVLCFGFLVAKNLLLMSVTYPALGALLLRTYLPLTQALERMLLQWSPQRLGLPVFELLECRIHSEAAPAVPRRDGRCGGV
jgi:ubiquinone/menaquinone biosynthesis C-methylase UbiE